MSGGRFDYKELSLKREIFGWRDISKGIPNVFEDREISGLTYDLLSLIHEYDLYDSGDTDKETYVKKKKAFKEKWLKSPDSRVKRIVDEAVAELKEELYETYEIT